MLSFLRRDKSKTAPLGPVENMAATARRPVPQPSELAELKGQEVVSRNLIGKMIGVEAEAKAEMEKKHAAIQKRIAQLEMITKVVGATDSAYKILDMEPLKLRRDGNAPVMAVFGLDNPTFRLNVKATGHNYRREGSDHSWWRNNKWERSATPVLPEDLMEMYKDVFVLLEKRAKDELPWLYEVGATNSDDFHVTATFKGAIPADVKEEIGKAMQFGVFKQIFLVAECEMKQGSDPLVVGWDGANYWLIKPFATTSVEQMMADKFTTKP